MTVGASIMVESVAGVPYASKNEQQLLPELLAVLKGAPSEIIRYDERNDLFQVAVEKLDLEDAVVHLVRSIAEAGWLYARHIRPFMQSCTTYSALTEPMRASSPDAITQESRTRSALRSAVAAELQAYHAALDQAERLQLQGWLTLPQLSLLMEPHRSVLLRWLAMISDALRDQVDREKDAARILDLLWQYRSHGDPAVRQLVDRLFSAASAPMNLVIISWVTHGDLMGAENEYFIRLDEHRFPALVPEALPTLIPQLVADRIFHAGLSRFLYRKWAKQSVFENETRFSASRAVLVDAAVVGSTTKWMQRLDLIEHLRHDVPIRDLFLERFRLLQQLEFHRMFVLLENSDFAGHLIEKLEPLLRCKTTTVERSHLVQALVEALALSGLGRSVRSSVDSTQDCLDVYLVDPHARDQGLYRRCIHANLRIPRANSLSLAPMPSLQRVPASVQRRLEVTTC
ncbi:Microtubule-nucleating Tub4p (gamma-tubulin) complex component [Cyanidiococcus yangmingshanensis]|uniref:Spindle pole body component n=1 Tax=Cyanidiococcus yangmingshanensis TaxID=2690220 RepID=A0A7J7IJC0_9RHOD|nr:Microtubule-nucleating Tub4p (gamma-tubulin) complex component [Cyanidiococcus yangmingshanensis]